MEIQVSLFMSSVMNLKGHGLILFIILEGFVHVHLLPFCHFNSIGKMVGR